jgi:DNA-binding winged helix-turn-helix (wHTH) protein/Tfp pilus assembly protein PilF
MFSKPASAFKMSADVLRFGPYSVDLRGHSLLKAGCRVSIQEQPFQILLALLENPGQVVTRDRLRLLLWGSETFVDFDQSMNSAIRRLRSALEDNPKQPEYIETVPRVGFRFRAPVYTDEESRFEEHTPPVISSVAHTRIQIPAWTGLLAAVARLPFTLSTAVLVCAACVGTLWFTASGHSLHTVVRSPIRGSVKTYSPAEVLSTGNTFNSTGIGAGVLSTSLPAVRAAGMTDILFDPKAVRTGALTPPAKPLDQAILQGRYFLALRNVDSYQRASEAFHQALSLDQNSTAALVGLAQVHVLLSMEGVAVSEHTAEAMSLAQRALTLDPNLASAHTAMAAAHVVKDWNWAAARGEFQKAIALDPGDSLAHLWYAMFVLVPARQYVEAERQILRAIELDPFSLIAQTNLGLIYSNEGRREEALAQYRLVLHMNPNFTPARYRIAQLLESEGLHQQALPFEPSDVSAAHRKLHLAWLHQSSTGDPCTLAGLALSRRAPNVGVLLRAGVQDHCAPLIYLNQDPNFARLQKDPRFAALASSLNLPEP